MGKPMKKDHVNKGKHSMNADREKPEKGSSMRSRTTIKRLKMYKNFKAKRNADGKIIRPAPFQSTLPSGSSARVEPNRRWFGNTRVISQDNLQKFKEAMNDRNPYNVVLRTSKLPISLLDVKKQKSSCGLLAHQSFDYAFGKKAQRKHPKLQCEDAEGLVSDVQLRQGVYDSEKDLNIVRDNGGVRDAVSDPFFKAGQSKRVWNELFKVLDSSDVVLYMLDARDPMGTRSRYIEKYLRTEKPHKHLVFVINKVDLVPVWVTKRWKMILSSEYPTIVFHAHLTKPLGKVALHNLLRQFARFHRDKQQISVGVIGYPNVGKSSLINAMRSKKVCKVAPISGETKVWQYVSLIKSIYLIDCPGVVYPEGSSEADLVLKGVVRVEYLKQPELYIDQLMATVKSEFLRNYYGLPMDTKDGCTKSTVDFASSEEFLELLAKKSGKLLKGGEPDLPATAKRVLNDFQRGKLPYFVKPPTLPAAAENTKSTDHSGPVADNSEDNLPETRDALDELETVASTVETADSTVETGTMDAASLPDDTEVGAPSVTSHTRKRRPRQEDEDVQLPRLTAKQRRRFERQQRPKRAGKHFYKEVNVKNRRHRQEDDGQ